VELDLQANLSQNFSATFGTSYNDTEIKDGSLYVLPCGSGCTVTNPVSFVERHPRRPDQRQPAAARAEVAAQLHAEIQRPGGQRRSVCVHRLVVPLVVQLLPV
jgi:hypothetical protein